MVDLRYLGLTVISVFLALAIGIMIGSALGGPDRRDAAYAGLREQFELLREENQKVSDANEQMSRREQRLDQAIQELSTANIRGRLPGSVVAVLLCGGVDERQFWSRLDNSLTIAGASIGPIIRIPDRLQALSTSDRRRMARLWGAEPLPLERAPYETLNWLVGLLASRHLPEQLDELAALTGLQVRGASDVVIRRVLVLSAASEERDALISLGDLPETALWDACAKRGLHVVIGEPESSTGQVADLLGQRGATVVDNVDRAAGQVSVVLTLAGAVGRYGTRVGSSRPIPPVESP